MLVLSKNGSLPPPLLLSLPLPLPLPLSPSLLIKLLTHQERKGEAIALWRWCYRHSVCCSRLPCNALSGTTAQQPPNQVCACDDVAPLITPTNLMVMVSEWRCLNDVMSAGGAAEHLVHLAPSPSLPHTRPLINTSLPHSHLQPHTMAAGKVHIVVALQQLVGELSEAYA